MQPKISERKQIVLMGMSFYGDPFDTHAGWDEENQIGRLWKRFLGYMQRHAESAHKLEQANAMYEVCIYGDEAREKGLFEIFVGMECSLEEALSVPVELSIKVFPDTQYAVFTIQGEEIKTDWEAIFQGWLATSGYHSQHSYNFQYYDERFKGLDRLADSILDVYIPITPD